MTDYFRNKIHYKDVVATFDDILILPGYTKTFEINLSSKIGKYNFSVPILTAAMDTVTEEEMAIMKAHPEIGAKILSGSESRLLKIAEIVSYTHHEKWDGTGYPKGLKREEIPLEGRIAGICDTFDALISERPYKKAWSMEEAMVQIRSQSETHFDPGLVMHFMALEPQLKKIVEMLGLR